MSQTINIEIVDDNVYTMTVSVEDRVGGGAVDSVNAQTGTVVLNATQIDIDALTPSNYTPSSTDIEGHFDGVDDALGSIVTDWNSLLNRPEYTESASEDTLSFSDVESAYRVGTPDTPVSTASFTLSQTNEVPGVSNVIHFNGAALPSFVAAGRTVTVFNPDEFPPLEDCVIIVELQPDLNYLVYISAPLDIPDVSGLAEKNVEIVTVSGTTHTVSASDFGKYVRFTSADPVTVTLPTGITLTGNYNVATYRQAGAGTVTFSPAGGVTVNGNLVMNGENSNLQLIQVAADEYDELGGITP